MVEKFVNAQEALMARIIPTKENSFFFYFILILEYESCVVGVLSVKAKVVLWSFVVRSGQNIDLPIFVNLNH
jgi:hypothetical protein